MHLSAGSLVLKGLISEKNCNLQSHKIVDSGSKNGFCDCSSQWPLQPIK